MTLSRMLARPMLASVFVAGGVAALKDAKSKAGAAEPVTDRLVPLLQKLAPQLPIPEDPTTLVRISGAAQVVAGLALATGRAPRLSATVLAVTLVPTTVAEHPFWEEPDPAAKRAQRQHFLKNVSMLGGLFLAAVDTEGKPGLAWRAQRVAGDARREARQLAREARREARLARARLT
ncbi:DoxX family protein [Nocardioides bigeumensis]|uniref:DoxX family protein n=1 Tax=Nocardioides bigeumensis TaxID=433657 RepID=A0ABP5K5V7_9ACTN